MTSDKNSILHRIKSLGINTQPIVSKENKTHFNNNKYPSDTTGKLAGSVYYVQNSIIPANNHIIDDIQPRIISNRQTMVLFKPNEFIDYQRNIKIQVIDNQSNITFSTNMKNPENITKACTPIYADITIPSPKPDEKIIIIDNNEIINKLNSPQYFNDVIVNHDVIKIITTDGHYAASFKVESDENYSLRKMIFKCYSTCSFFVLFNDRKVELKHGDDLEIFNINGTWYQVNEDDQFLSEIDYIGNCWSAIIPSHFIKPNISLKFSHFSKVGTIKHIDIGSPNELLLNTIAIGMLTPYREKFEFQKKTEYHRQYFQQVPLSRLIVSTYDPIYLTEVMLHDGRLLTDHDPSNGGWHTGTMREYVAKAIIASGINHANYGLITTGRNRGVKMLASQITVHTSIGRYVNGVKVHGGSGGAGLATLDNTIRNEFSHEVGHNYGLSHYPGGFYGSVNAIPSERNSTWGWDSNHNFFIPNFEYATRNKPTYLEKEGEGLYAVPFNEHSLGRDAMAGGGPMYPLHNEFTLHTPYSLKKIQTFLESKAFFNANSVTGFSRWNEKSQKVEDYHHSTLKYIYSEVPLKNGKNIIAEEFIKIFEKNNAAKVTCYNGHHAPNIFFPEATDYQDYNITISTSAFYSINVHFSQTQATLRKGETKHFTSNGTEWFIQDESSLQKELVPYKQGIKVITLVGLHDPENQLTSYIYPALNGSYGMVYPDMNYEINLKDDYLEVRLFSGKYLRYQLASFRIVKNEMNQFHVNIERSLRPIEARIIHDGVIVASKNISLGSDDLMFTINNN